MRPVLRWLRSVMGAGVWRLRLGGQRRRWVLGATAAVAVALMGVFVASALGVLAGSPSKFEANDGNMVVDTAGNADWNSVQSNPNYVHLTDLFNTTGDDSFKPGQKQDTACPVIATNKNPGKDDFTDVASFSETNLDSGSPQFRHTFLYGATIRFTANGSASENVELNQGTNGNCGVDPVTGKTLLARSSGDKLIAIDYTVGGTVVSFHVLTWIVDTSDPNNATCLVKNDSPPCWGANSQALGANAAEGLANQSPIFAADNKINNQALVTNQFAEFGVDLTASGIVPAASCEAFPQTVWESRSSGSSFVSSTEDVSLEQHTISNCGEIIVKKRTDPRGKDQVFSYTSNLPQNTAAGGVNCPGNSGAGIRSDGSFCLNDAGNSTADSTANTVDTGSNVVAGSYTVTEGADPSGFTFENLSCQGGTTSTSGKTATITLAPGDKVTCIYVNQLNTATLATQVSNAGPVFPGVAVHDTATVTGSQAAETPSGTVTFFLCGPTASDTGCSAGGMNIGTGSLSGSGATASVPSPDVNTSGSPLTAGHYCFRAIWPGDNNYPGALTEFGGVNGTNECFTVRTIPTTTTTTPSVGSGGTTTFGSSVTDHAIVQATQTGDGTPTGTVTFFVCDPTQTSGGACPTGGTQLGSPVTTTAVANSSPPASSADSDPVTVNKTGTWCFRAVYTPGGANGSNYDGSSDATSGECFTVTETTTSSSAQDWLPNDTATVTAAHGAPLNGTLSAQLYTGDNCGATSGSAVSGQQYDKTLTNATSAADTTLTTNNTTFKVSTSTSVSWLVTFTSTDANVAPSSHCEVTSLTINN